jgi:hypothetical protein
MHGLALTVALHSGASVTDAPLQQNDFCAGSPLTVGTEYRGATVTDIHMLENAHGRPVGWIYTMSTGPSYLQANERMSADDQHALSVSTGDALSEPRVRPARLPVDLDVKACDPAEVRVY